MFNITLVSGSNQYAASHYFSAMDDYYIGEGEGGSSWQGKGAEELGLTGAVDQTQFSRMLAGRLPNGKSINSLGEEKRMGWDLTFSAPKSVSMQALIAGDSRIAKAHDEAVSYAVEHVEKLAMARKKINGKSSRERTGNVIVAKFRHALSRTKDPQLHTHAIVLNVTQRNDGEWRALTADDMYRVQHEIDAIYKTELASKLQGIGYEIRATDEKGGFELAHITRGQIEAFSARSLTIENVLADKGKTRATATSKEKQSIALATRPRKERGDLAAIKERWTAASSEIGISYDAKSSSAMKTGQADQGNSEAQVSAKVDLPANLTPAQAVVRYAINHLTERESIVSKSRLVTVSLRRAIGLVDAKAVEAEIRRLESNGSLIASSPMYSMADKNGDFKPRTLTGWISVLQKTKGWDVDRAHRYVDRAVKQGTLVATERCYTTPKALKQEKAILAIERDGRNAVPMLVSSTVADKALAKTTLNEGQREAVKTVVSTSNRFVGIQGDAGTGKTFAVEKAVALINDNTEGAYKIMALAPYGNQVKVLKNEGMNAKTLASFLYSKDKKIDDKTVVILDEAAVVGSRQMSELMRTVEKAGARLIMLGDTKQVEAIEAGKPFAQLQQKGMQTARIYEVLRQQDPMLKSAVEKVAIGNARASLSDIAVVEQIVDSKDRHQAIVNDYMKMTPEQRGKTLVIAGTNNARREINGMVRQALRLAGQGREFDTLNRVDMTQAQRRNALSYERGMVVQPERDYPAAGLVRWESYQVNEVHSGNMLELKAKDGTTLTVNPRKVTKLSVYHLERSELAVGDTIRITRNDIGNDLTNGDKMRVVGVTPMSVQLERIGEEHRAPLDLDARTPLHVAHAYSSTVHSSQGMTSDKVLISLDVHSRTTSKNLYYVAISRARHEARIYTNSANDLPRSISRLYSKTTALSLQDERVQAKQIKVPQSVTMEKKGKSGQSIEMAAK